jgi:hypothetical protein
MINPEHDAQVTLSPCYDNAAFQNGKYRWSLQIPLPFPFPVRKCVRRTPTIANESFEFSIHNHFDRLLLVSKETPGLPRVFLYEKGQSPAKLPKDTHLSRENLQSVAYFVQSREFTNPTEAFADSADKKIAACFQYLSDVITDWQKAAPYLSAWLVHPISISEVGTVFHCVDRWCPHQNRWEAFASSVAMSIVRNLQFPIMFAELSNGETKSEIDLANELLAEASVSIFRGLLRPAVVGSYTAAESFANDTWTIMTVKKLELQGVQAETAIQITEELRQRHKTDIKFLLHKGILDACGRSLHDENKHLYDKFFKVNDLRNKVAHSGYKPSKDEAKSAHRTSCEVVQWLAGVAGLPVKPLFPSKEDSVPGLQILSQAKFGIDSSQMDYLRRMLGQ